MKKIAKRVRRDSENDALFNLKFSRCNVKIFNIMVNNRTFRICLATTDYVTAKITNRTSQTTCRCSTYSKSEKSWPRNLRHIQSSSRQARGTLLQFTALHSQVIRRHHQATHPLQLIQLNRATRPRLLRLPSSNNRHMSP